MIKFVPPTEELILELVENMREEEVAEVWAAAKFTPKDAIEWSLNRAHEAACAVYDDKLLCIFGVSARSLMSDVASPWLLTTNENKNRPRHLLKWTKLVVKRWSTMWPVLENYVDNRYDASLRWAKWAGFTVHDPQPYGPFGLPFNKIEIRRD